MFKARFIVVIGLLTGLQVGLAGCGISLDEPLYGNYDRSDTTRLQRRSDVRACERGHQKLATGPANRNAALTNLRVENCLEHRGYRRRSSFP